MCKDTGHAISPQGPSDAGGLSDASRRALGDGIACTSEGATQRKRLSGPLHTGMPYRRPSTSRWVGDGIACKKQEEHGIRGGGGVHGGNLAALSMEDACAGLVLANQTVQRESRQNAQAALLSSTAGQAVEWG
jgi:hypothetical protein